MQKGTMKAFLGMGLLGSNFVKAMLAKGEKVQVWNRTYSKAAALEPFGAVAFEDAAAAVAGAGVIHLALKDDETVDEVLGQAAAGLLPGAIIIDHTTTSVEGAVKRTAEWKALGFTYLHAPVFMGPVNALESTGYMLVSGDQAVVGQWQPWLAQLTGKLINFGEDTGKAAGMKLLGNLFLVAFTGGMADMFSLAKALGIAPTDVFTLFDSWNPGAGVPARLRRVASANYSNPSWALSMARKDARLFMEAADKGGTKLTVIPAVAAEMDRWIEKGHGEEDWTVIASDSVSQP